MKSNVITDYSQSVHALVIRWHRARKGFCARLCYAATPMKILINKARCITSHSIPHGSIALVSFRASRSLDTGGY